MYNWRLMLLAFLAVFQPITSFTERNLVDGREQCSDRNSLLRDSKHAYGRTRFTKLPEDHRLSRTDTREDRRYEVRREDNVLARSSVDRRFVDYRLEKEDTRLTTERAALLIRAEIRRERTSVHHVNNPNDKEQRVRNVHRISSRYINKDMQVQDISRMRDRVSNSRQRERNNQEISPEKTSTNRITREINIEQFRHAMDSRRDTRQSRAESIKNVHRIRETREKRDVDQRSRNAVTRNDITRNREVRLIARERVEIERRSRSDIRLDNNNRVRLSEGRRVRESDHDRRSSIRPKSLDNVHLFREDHHTSLRDVNRADNYRQQRVIERDSREIMSVRRDMAQHSIGEKRNAPETTARFRNLDNRSTRFEHARSLQRYRSDDRDITFRNLNREGITPQEIRRVESRRERTLMRERNNIKDNEFRSAERREIRNMERNSRTSKSIDIRERDISNNRIEFMSTKRNNRDTNNVRLRTNSRVLTRDNLANIRDNKQSDEKQPMALNWQYVFYTLQGIYLGGLLLQIIAHKESDKKLRVFSWLSPPRSLLKVD